MDISRTLNDENSTVNVSSTSIDWSVEKSEEWDHDSTLPLNPLIQSLLKDLLEVSLDSHSTLIDSNVYDVVNSSNIDPKPYHYHLPPQSNHDQPSIRCEPNPKAKVNIS